VADQFDALASELVEQWAPGQHDHYLRLRERIADALQSVAEQAWEDGYWAAEQDKFKRLTANPHRKSGAEQMTNPSSSSTKPRHR